MLYKKYSLGLIFLIVLIILLLAKQGFQLIQNPPDKPCPANIESRLVRGDSMSGLIDEGKEVKILVDYYNCNPVQRGEVVAFHYAGDNNPIIKMVRGVPGDTFSADKTLAINGQELLNSNDQSYILDDQAAKTLNLYIKDYQGKIPADTYLILGNLSQGSTDSTRFGLVGKNDIIGKVIY